MLRYLLAASAAFSSIAGAELPSTSAAAAPATRNQIPFLYEDSRIYVPVRIGAGLQRWFILDTGASATIIDQSVAKAEHLEVAGSETVHGAGSGSSKEGQSSSIDLMLGGIAMHIDRPAVLDLARLLGPTSGRAPAGIIGSDFFSEHFVDIDFARRRIAIDPGMAERRLRYSTSVPLTFVEQTPLTHVTLKLQSGRTVEANALVDLGAKATFLVPEPFIAREKLRQAIGRSVTTGFGAGVGGDTFYAFGRASRLGFAAAPAFAIDRPVIGLSVGGTLRSTWNEGLLGAEFLSNFRIGFDYQHKRLLLGPAQAHPNAFDRSGLFLVASGGSLDRIIVRQVVKGGPGDKAGFLPMDEILAVDGKSAGRTGLAGLRQIFKEPGTTVLRIVYRRGTEQRTSELELRDLV